MMMWLGTERRKGDARNRNTLVPTMRLWVAVVIQESPPKEPEGQVGKDHMYATQNGGDMVKR